MATQETPAAVSGMLLAAQERLLELRAAHQATKEGTVGAGPRTRPLAPTADSIAEAVATTIATLPDHLGWENPQITNHIRRALARREASDKEASREGAKTRSKEGQPAFADDLPSSGVRGTASDSPSRPFAPSRLRERPDTEPTTIKVYPDIALAMLREKQSAAGRVWLLLRHLDSDGRGWVSEADAYAALAPTEKRTAESGPMAICGRRQLDNLLKQGDGVFWDLPDLRGFRKPLRSKAEDRRIWLRSVARVAAALGVGRLGTAPVAVDITALTASIGRVRAHLYASFHSGRQKRDFVTGRARPRAPIARETMQTLSAACPNSQRAYERRAGVGRQATFAVGNEIADRTTQTAESQETAWRHGRATFRLIDKDGRFGRAGRTYLAWQLPNEYTGPHQRLSRSRMKRLNRALADLLVNGMTGNDEHHANGGRSTRPTTKRFFGNAKALWTAERQHKLPDESYWRGPDGAWQSVVSGQGPVIRGQGSVGSEQGSGVKGQKRITVGHPRPRFMTNPSPATDHRQPPPFNRSLTPDNRLLVTDHWSPVTDYRPLTPDNRLLVTDH